MAKRDAFSLFRGESAGPAADAELRSIPLGTLVPHPENRPIKQEAVEELAEGIERDGLAQPILVRHVRGGYQIVAGHHRAAAYRLLLERSGDEAAWGSIPAYVRADLAGDDEAARRLMCATNLLVARLDPEEELRQYRYLFGEAKRARAEDREAFRGMRTEDLVATAVASMGGPSVTGRTLQRRMRDAEVERARAEGRARAVDEWEAVFSKRQVKSSFKKDLAELGEDDQREVYRGYVREGRRIEWAAREVALRRGDAGRVVSSAADGIIARIGELSQAEPYDRDAVREATRRIKAAVRHLETF